MVSARTVARSVVDGALSVCVPMAASSWLRSPWITARLSLVAALPSRKFMPARTRAFLDYMIEHTRKTVADLGVDAPPPVRT